MDKIKIDIPIPYLLQIATHGHLGTGEFGNMMKAWAERELIQNGFSEELKQMQIDKLNELHKNLTNVLGKDIMNKLDNGIEMAKKAINLTMKELKS